MGAQHVVTTAAPPEKKTSETASVYVEGIIAGMIGAAVIAIWFLILDSINGRPLYTPTVLGTALFRGGVALASREILPVSLEMVLLYTCVHGIAFCTIGAAASRFLAIAEMNPDLGFGILLLFIVFEAGFISVSMFFAEEVLQALAWAAVFVGNLLAASAMAIYFWRKHTNLTIRP
ncbi:MAG: hypothetical protein ACE5G5_11075 [Candidatus Methylomirabilales bacterium]